MKVFQFFIICKRNNNANNATHYVALGKKRRESSKCNYYVMSSRVIIKAIIIKEENVRQCRRDVAYTMPDLSSVVPPPHFVTTMGRYLIKIWNPRENFLGEIIHPKSSIGSQGKVCQLGFATRSGFSCQMAYVEATSTWNINFKSTSWWWF